MRAWPTRTVLALSIAVAVGCGGMAAAEEGPSTGAPLPADGAVIGGREMSMATFLDRLMMAESGGRDTLANPRSTAVGAYQFIVGTFLAVVRRHFAAETAGQSPEQILALRTNRVFARRAAEAFTTDNAAHLANAGLPASWPNLRLAFLVGAEGAIRVLKAPPASGIRALLGNAVVNANPFMATMTAGGLVNRSARELSLPAPIAIAAATPPERALRQAGLGSGGRLPPAAEQPRKVEIPVRCELSLASCRRWLALAERRALRIAATTAPGTPGRSQRR